MPKRVVRVDKGVAAKHGYRIVTLTDGSLASVKVETYAKLGSHPQDAAVRAAADGVFDPSSGAARAAHSVNGNAVTPDDYVYGNCGDSYYFIGASGSGGEWSSVTGYDVVGPVADFNWWTAVYNPQQSEIESQEYGSYPTGPSWEGSYGSPPDFIENGNYRGMVTSGTAYLDNGWVCDSGHPGDWTYNP